mgnify:CR=1 FL=1
MRILLAASEVAPLAKTGGLADVCGALPRALARLGHEVAVILPFYAAVDRRRFQPTPLLRGITVHLPADNRDLNVWELTLPGAADAPHPVRVWLVEDDALFGRPALYAEHGRDYPDNAFRFAYFCLAALWTLKGLGWYPDVIHCNDWQTALIPVYLRHYDAVRADADLARIRTLFTIHNISYQGLFPPHFVHGLGLPPHLYQPEAMEFHGHLNLLKGGLLYSDALSTVSRQYAREIQTPEFGYGLEGLLRLRAADLTGILNGIDVEEWDPARDPALAAPYSPTRLRGKAACKKALQQACGLPARPGTPLLGMISRLVEQKGLDLVAEVLPDLLQDDVQFVLLGSGQPEYHALFTALARKFPRKIAVHLRFDNDLAHRIEAGADLFLMPSRFEPCGLNQLYSLRYGTLPVVRRTGGLADSVVNATAATIKAGTATGFVFTPCEARAFAAALRRALRLYRKEPDTWTRLVRNAMVQDFSWARSARAYEKLYRKLARSAPAPGA